MMLRKLPVPLPTRNFAALVFVLAAMWYAASSQNNGASYLLLFALSGIFLVSIPRTWLNLGGLKLNAEAIKPAFAGQEVAIPVEITNQSRVTRCGICVHSPKHNDTEQRIDNIAAGKAARLTLRFAAPDRGEHLLDSLCLVTAYPLGFVRAARECLVSRRYLVYPKPAGNPNLPADPSSANPNAPQSQLGEGDDFAGVRAYVPGESQRRVDWKAVARGQAMMTKQFVIETSGQFYVDLALARNGNLEDRLSQLALWIVEAARAHRPYGLRLPGIDVKPSLGDHHFHRCLRELALFNQ